VLPVLVHGDAAFAGQGVVMETLNLAQTRGYGTGGTMHIVINNQIGFTTSDPRDARSTLYCTDVVKMIEAPVLHVNGDDPEAVVYAMQLAVDFRMEFNKDVVVDIICFRKLGHNEQTRRPDPAADVQEDRPAPGHAQAVRRQAGGAEPDPAEFGDELVKAYRAAMDAGKHTVDPVLSNFKNKFAVDWMPFLNRKWTDAADTAVPMTELKRLAERITTIPSTSSCTRWWRRSSRTAPTWAAASRCWTGAWANTWPSPRWWPRATRCASPARTPAAAPSRTATPCCTTRTASAGMPAYVPLQNVSENQAPFTVIDSVLSEEAVLGFEYGYSTAEPNTLVIWEAQFGDFVNGAQVVIDQFISSGEVKWGRASGLTMMLPHGYEGQGPEHSSARIERFLQLCADHNMQVVQPTTPAQIFHLLRRQMIRLFRKPLVIMTPKSLLRNKDAVSPLSDLAKGISRP
jgi:2-oxoglutarate dehydrogenase E1 component